MTWKKFENISEGTKTDLKTSKKECKITNWLIFLPLKTGTADLFLCRRDFSIISIWSHITSFMHNVSPYLNSPGILAGELRISLYSHANIKFCGKFFSHLFPLRKKVTYLIPKKTNWRQRRGVKRKKKKPLEDIYKPCGQRFAFNSKHFLEFWRICYHFSPFFA